MTGAFGRTGTFCATLAVVILAVFALLMPTAAPTAPPNAPPPGLTAFRTKAELTSYMRALRTARNAGERRRGQADYDMASPPPPPPPAVMAPSPAAESVVVTGSKAAGRASDDITNTQVAGVDEGGIVKARGDILVVLRRGRLFTVSTANGAMRPVAAIDAMAPGVSGRGDWYDEMLVAGDWVAVIGYSYARRGTQVNRFRLGPQGQLSFVDAYSFRSADYYSSRNYASRLIGKRLVLYAPIPLDIDRWEQSFPTLTRWRGDGRADPAKPLWQANMVYVPERVRRAGPWAVTTVHSVTSCDLTAAVLDCDATSVLGSSSRTFFVSQNAVYVWTGLNAGASEYSGGAPRFGASALLYRLPFDTSRPQAVAARGQPVDQFSFLADDKRSALQIVVGSGGGDRMWGPEWTNGRLALVTVPMTLFGNGAAEVPQGRYQPLPGEGSSWGIQNRFVGDHLLYGMGGYARDGRVIENNSVRVVSLATRAVTAVALPHRVDRLDAIGPDAVVVGQGAGYLGFSAIDLGIRPSLAAEYRLPDAAEGESRSQAFFFHPDARDPAGRSGLLGLPVARQFRFARGFQPSAAIVFLRRNGRDLGPNGELAATRGEMRDDGCRASCVDWYGNARPIFRGPRVFALLGYELVEGRATPGRMDEVGRVDMATLVRRGDPVPRP